MNIDNAHSSIFNNKENKSTIIIKYHCNYTHRYQALTAEYNVGKI